MFAASYSPLPFVSVAQLEAQPLPCVTVGGHPFPIRTDPTTDDEEDCETPIPAGGRVQRNTCNTQGQDCYPLEYGTSQCKYIHDTGNISGLETLLGHLEESFPSFLGSDSFR